MCASEAEKKGAPVRQGLPGSSLDIIPGPLEMCQHMGGRAVLTPVGSWLWNWHGGQTLVWGYLLQQAWKFLSFQGLLFTQTCLGWVCPEMELGLWEGAGGKWQGYRPPFTHNMVTRIHPSTAHTTHPTHLPFPQPALLPVLKSSGARLFCVEIQGQPSLTVT